MSKLILTKGLPASGKTTWAKNYIAKNPNSANLCKDDLRIMFQDTKSREKSVIKTRDYLTEFYLKEHKDVIWSDTNLNPIHLIKAKEIGASLGVQVVVQDFTDVALEECIRRDLLRANPVGQTVIEQMYYNYVFVPQIPAFDSILPGCYIFDIDGTLANRGNRQAYEWAKVDLDTVNSFVKNMFDLCQKSNQEIFVFSGRDEICKEMSYKWLSDNGIKIKIENLQMRELKNQESDEIIKERLFRNIIEHKFNVLGIFDDRPKVCRMWRRLGLPLFQVGNPDFEF